MHEDWYKRLAEQFWLEPEDDGVEDAAFIANALKLRPGGRVLDAPCGAGRIAVHLARAGCLVTGIDFKPAFIRLAREQFASQGNPGDFICMDLQEMDFADTFDAACNWSGSFGYFSEVKNLELLDRYARSLRSGGRLLVEQANREVLLRGLGAAETPISSHLPAWDKTTNRLLVNLDTSCRRPRHESQMSIRLYTADEMHDLFEAAGLVVENVYGSNQGEPYSRSSKHLIVVGRK